MRHLLQGLAVSAAFLLIAAPLRAEDVVVSFSSLVTRFYEAEGVGHLTVTRTGPPGAALSVPFHSKIDTTQVDGTFTFQPNEVVKVFDVPIPKDGAFDQWDTEQQFDYYVELRPVFPIRVGAFPRIRIQLMEGDPMPVISVTSAVVPEGNSGSTLVHLGATLSAPFKRAGFIGWTLSGGTATAGSDFETGGYTTLALGQTSVDIVVRIYGDQLPEPDEFFYVHASVNGYGVDHPGTITILNDDYILSPDTQRIARGSFGSASVFTSVPTPTTDHVLLSSSNPSIVTVPPFIDIPAGSLTKTFDVTAVGTGSAVITATFPPSRGSTTATTRVDVYTSTYGAFDQPVLSGTFGQTATATMHVDPPPPAAFSLFLSQTNPSVASIPPTFVVGTDGVGTFTLRGNGAGTTIVSTTLPVSYGSVTTGFIFDVANPTALTISRLDSTSGPSSGGKQVRIYAEPMNGRCTAMFDGVSGQNTTSAASGFLTTTPPPHDPGPVAVSLRCGSDTSVLPDAYTYTALPSRLLRISPALGAITGGTVVAVSGENLRRGRCSLSFGGVAAAMMQNDSATEMLISTPPHATGGVDVSLLCGSDVSTLANAFFYAGSDLLPQIAGANPASGAPGERLIVGGSGFRDSDAIFFNGTPGIDMTTTSSEHFITVPDLSVGNATITLHDMSGHTVPGPVFRVLASPAPQITSAPARAAAASEFLINGSGFRSSLNFLLGVTVLQQVSVAPTFARLRLPPSIAPGSYPLTIVGSTTTAHAIEVTPGVAVISVSIPCSSTAGGQLVTITGNGFAAGAVVTFGIADSPDATVRDEHTILARVPPWSGLSNETITVTNRNGESGLLSNAIRYLWPDPGCGVPRHRGARP